MKVLILGRRSRLAQRLHLLTSRQTYMVARPVTIQAAIIKRRITGPLPQDEAVEVVLGHADVTNLGQVLHAMSCKPDLVINCAAKTNVNLCESSPATALAVNALGAANVAMACYMNGVRLIQISTDYVFSGINGPYADTDVPYPVNSYGASKLLGEDAALSINPDTLVVRVGWLYGREYLGSQPMQAAPFRRTGPTHASKDLTNTNFGYIHANIEGTPSFVGHVAVTILHNLTSTQVGVVHVSSGEEPITWFDLLAQDFAVVPLNNTTHSGRPTSRPALGGLVPSEGWVIPDYRAGLTAFIKESRDVYSKAGTGS